MTRGASPHTALESRLGYRFHQPELLTQALTHPASGAALTNQRLEYLGDALLYGALSLVVYREKPAWPEGHLSKLRHLLVSSEALCAWAEDLEVVLIAGTGKNAPSRLKTTFRKPLADAMEAILAAVFLDDRARGGDGFGAVERLVEARFLAQIRAADIGIWERHDPKTTLQERAATLGLSHPAYALLGRSGPDHAPRFTVEVRVGTLAAQAEEGSRRAAEAAAAASLLARLAQG